MPTKENISHGETTEVDAPSDDQIAMARTGKKQQLMRIFGFMPTLFFAMTLLGSWETIALTFAPGLTNGGPVSLVYGMILTSIGTLAVAASLAEMASLCPISGAQYHWTYMFAPPRAAAFLSWMQGWITVFAWQASVTGAIFLTATSIQGLAVLDFHSYDPYRWQGTLMMWAVLAYCYIVNVWGIRLLPSIELFGGSCHILFFFMILIALVVVAPKRSASFVFTHLENGGGWASDGVSWCIGLLTVAFALAGCDAAIHMAEEVRHSATAVPRAIVWAVILNGITGFAFLIAALFCMGSLEKDLNSPTGYPIIAIFHQATGSVAAATVMDCAIVLVSFAACPATLASISRLTFSFARDGAMPFSDYFAHVDPYHHVPLRAINLNCVVVVLLSLINIGSTIALNAVISLATLALYISYIVPIGLLLVKRLRGQHIEFGPYNFGRYGAWINAVALVWSVFVTIWLPFPSSPNPDAGSMNYAGPVFGLLVLLALIAWLVSGRKTFVGPRREIDRREALGRAEHANADAGELEQIKEMT